MKITETNPGNVVQFVTKVDKSSKGQKIQEVHLRVESVTDLYITGINVNRITDGSESSLPYRTYKIENIIPGTVWLKLED